MTRGIVVVKDASRQEILYLPSDAYIGGSVGLSFDSKTRHLVDCAAEPFNKVAAEAPQY